MMIQTRISSRWERMSRLSCALFILLLIISPLNIEFPYNYSSGPALFACAASAGAYSLDDQVRSNDHLDVPLGYEPLPGRSRIEYRSMWICSDLTVIVRLHEMRPTHGAIEVLIDNCDFCDGASLRLQGWGILNATGYAALDQQPVSSSRPAHIVLTNNRFRNVNSPMQGAVTLEGSFPDRSSILIRNNSVVQNLTTITDFSAVRLDGVRLTRKSQLTLENNTFYCRLLMTPAAPSSTCSFVRWEQSFFVSSGSTVRMQENRISIAAHISQAFRTTNMLRWEVSQMSSAVFALNQLDLDVYRLYESYLTEVGGAPAILGHVYPLTVAGWWWDSLLLRLNDRSSVEVRGNMGTLGRASVQTSLVQWQNTVSAASMASPSVHLSSDGAFTIADNVVELHGGGSKGADALMATETNNLHVLLTDAVAVVVEGNRVTSPVSAPRAEAKSLLSWWWASIAVQAAGGAVRASAVLVRHNTIECGDTAGATQLIQVYTASTWSTTSNIFAVAANDIDNSIYGDPLASVPIMFRRYPAAGAATVVSSVAERCNTVSGVRVGAVATADGVSFTSSQIVDCDVNPCSSGIDCFDAFTQSVLYSASANSCSCTCASNLSPATRPRSDTCLPSGAILLFTIAPFYTQTRTFTELLSQSDSVEFTHTESPSDSLSATVTFSQELSWTDSASITASDDETLSWESLTLTDTASLTMEGSVTDSSDVTFSVSTSVTSSEEATPSWSGTVERTYSPSSTLSLSQEPTLEVSSSTSLSPTEEPSMTLTLRPTPTLSLSATTTLSASDTTSPSASTSFTNEDTKTMTLSMEFTGSQSLTVSLTRATLVVSETMNTSTLSDPTPSADVTGTASVTITQVVSSTETLLSTLTDNVTLTSTASPTKSSSSPRSNSIWTATGSTDLTMTASGTEYTDTIVHTVTATLTGTVTLAPSITLKLTVSASMSSVLTDSTTNTESFTRTGNRSVTETVVRTLSSSSSRRTVTAMDSSTGSQQLTYTVTPSLSLSPTLNVSESRIVEFRNTSSDTATSEVSVTSSWTRHSKALDRHSDTLSASPLSHSALQSEEETLTVTKSQRSRTLRPLQTNTIETGSISPSFQLSTTKTLLETATRTLLWTYSWSVGTERRTGTLNKTLSPSISMQQSVTFITKSLTSEVTISVTAPDTVSVGTPSASFAASKTETATVTMTEPSTTIKVTDTLNETSQTIQPSITDSWTPSRTQSLSAVAESATVTESVTATFTSSLAWSVTGSSTQQVSSTFTVTQGALTSTSTLSASTTSDFTGSPRSVSFSLASGEQQVQLRPTLSLTQTENVTRSVRTSTPTITSIQTATVAPLETMTASWSESSTLSTDETGTVTATVTPPPTPTRTQSLTDRRRALGLWQQYWQRFSLYPFSGVTPTVCLDVLSWTLAPLVLLLLLQWIVYAMWKCGLFRCSCWSSLEESENAFLEGRLDPRKNDSHASVSLMRSLIAITTYLSTLFPCHWECMLLHTGHLTIHVGIFLTLLFILCSTMTSTVGLGMSLSEPSVGVVLAFVICASVPRAILRPFFHWLAFFYRHDDNRVEDAWLTHCMNDDELAASHLFLATSSPDVVAVDFGCWTDDAQAHHKALYDTSTGFASLYDGDAFYDELTADDAESQLGYLQETIEEETLPTVDAILQFHLDGEMPPPPQPSTRRPSSFDNAKMSALQRVTSTLLRSGSGRRNSVDRWTNAKRMSVDITRDQQEYDDIDVDHVLEQFQRPKGSAPTIVTKEELAKELRQAQQEVVERERTAAAAPPDGATIAVEQLLSLHLDHSVADNSLHHAERRSSIDRLLTTEGEDETDVFHDLTVARPRMLVPLPFRDRTDELREAQRSFRKALLRRRSETSDVIDEVDKILHAHQHGVDLQAIDDEINALPKFGEEIQLAEEEHITMEEARDTLRLSGTTLTAAAPSKKRKSEADVLLSTFLRGGTLEPLETAEDRESRRQEEEYEARRKDLISHKSAWGNEDDDDHSFERTPQPKERSTMGVLPTKLPARAGSLALHNAPPKRAKSFVQRILQAHLGGQEDQLEQEMMAQRRRAQSVVLARPQTAPNGNLESDVADLLEAHLENRSPPHPVHTNVNAPPQKVPSTPAEEEEAVHALLQLHIDGDAPRSTDEENRRRAHREADDAMQLHLQEDADHTRRAGEAKRDVDDILTQQLEVENHRAAKQSTAASQTTMEVADLLSQFSQKPVMTSTTAVLLQPNEVPKEEVDDPLLGLDPFTSIPSRAELEREEREREHQLVKESLRKYEILEGERQPIERLADVDPISESIPAAEDHPVRKEKKKKVLSEHQQSLFASTPRIQRSSSSFVRRGRGSGVWSDDEEDMILLHSDDDASDDSGSDPPPENAIPRSSIVLASDLEPFTDTVTPAPAPVSSYFLMDDALPPPTTEVEAIEQDEARYQQELLDEDIMHQQNVEINDVAALVVQANRPQLTSAGTVSTNTGSIGLWFEGEDYLQPIDPERLFEEEEAVTDSPRAPPALLGDPLIGLHAPSPGVSRSRRGEEVLGVQLRSLPEKRVSWKWTDADPEEEEDEDELWRHVSNDLYAMTTVQDLDSLDEPTKPAKKRRKRRSRNHRPAVTAAVHAPTTWETIQVVSSDSPDQFFEAPITTYPTLWAVVIAIVLLLLLALLYLFVLTTDLDGVMMQFCRPYTPSLTMIIVFLAIDAVVVDTLLMMSLTLLWRYLTTTEYDTLFCEIHPFDGELRLIRIPPYSARLTMWDEFGKLKRVDVAVQTDD